MGVGMIELRELLEKLEARRRQLRRRAWLFRWRAGRVGSLRRRSAHRERADKIDAEIRRLELETLRQVERG